MSKTTRYQEDEAYREAVKARVRDNYTRVTESSNASDLLPVVEYYGVKRDIGGTTELTFTNFELAHLLGYHPYRLRGLQREGILPEPETEATPYARGKVYTKRQAVSLAKVLGKHQRSFAYLRSDHTKTVEALKAAMN